jgi:tetratricopeptide (TPR) repeat protein
MGIAYKRLGEHQRAIELYEQQRAIAREIGDRWGEASASWNLGASYVVLGELRKAVEALQLGVDIYRAIRHPNAEGHAQRLAQLRAKLKQ